MGEGSVYSLKLWCLFLDLLAPSVFPSSRNTPRRKDGHLMVPHHAKDSAWHTKGGNLVFAVTTHILSSGPALWPEGQLARTTSLPLIASLLVLAPAILRYLKNDGKIHLVVFNNLQLADGRRHRILLRLSNLQRETGSIELYLDCAQVDSVRGLPRAFSGLARNPESIELRTFQRKPQVGTHK